jgi:Bax protein
MTCNKIFRRGWFCAVLWVLLLAVSNVHAQSNSYVKKYQSTAIALMNEDGIPASVILGVAMLESGMGTSKNARLLHNHFGIVGKNKVHKQKGKVYHSKYREFETDEASYQNFAGLLTRKTWFPKLKGKSDYSLWLKQMNHAGYSSAGQEWVRRVTNMIKRYKLYKLDEQMAYSGS